MTVVGRELTTSQALDFPNESTAGKQEPRRVRHPDLYGEPR